MDGDGKKGNFFSRRMDAGEYLQSSEWRFLKAGYLRQLQFTDDKKTPASIMLDARRANWYCLKTVDIDNDGDQDIILGNRGTNATIKGKLL